MSTMYNMMFGQNQRAPLLMAILELTQEDVGRFRDCYLGEGCIALYTRLGGGNRDGFQEYVNRLQSHPLYSHDRDEELDCTYATFFFKYPPELAGDLEAIAEKVKDPAPSERWAKLLRELEAKKVNHGQK